MQTQSEGAIIAARALRNIAAHLSPAVAVNGLLDEFPWVEVLPESARQGFITDIMRAFQVSAELGQWSILVQTIAEWRSTAAVHADPVLSQKLSEPIDDDFSPVSAPMEA